ncbi:hypothetical protein AAGY10_14055, partial [Staphylococcus aureus]
ASWGGPQQREIGFPISTDNASWGGPQQREIGFPISTDFAHYHNLHQLQYTLVNNRMYFESLLKMELKF